MWALTNAELLDGAELHIEQGGLLIDDLGVIRAIDVMAYLALPDSSKYSGRIPRPLGRGEAA